MKIKNYNDNEQIFQWRDYSIHIQQKYLLGPFYNLSKNYFEKIGIHM